LVAGRGECTGETIRAMGVSFTAGEGLLGGFLVSCGPRRNSAPVGLGGEVVLSGEGLGALQCDIAPVEIK
jgi:hypothetical protein